MNKDFTTNTILKNITDDINKKYNLNLDRSIVAEIIDSQTKAITRGFTRKETIELHSFGVFKIKPARELALTIRKELSEQGIERDEAIKITKSRLVGTRKIKAKSFNINFNKLKNGNYSEGNSKEE